MATLLSPPPASGSSSSSGDGGGGRRLSELLEEQQEPFSLDLFLLDKGCFPALLDAAGAACWPRSRAAVRALRRRTPASGGSTRAGGLLRVILSKIILRGAAADKKVGRKRQQPAAIVDWSSRSSPSSRRVDGAGEADMEDEEEEDDDEDESSKQLSPVSVLEQSPFEPASPAYSKKAIVIFRELLAAAYTPALPDHPANHSKTPTTPSSPAPAPAPRTGRPTSSSSAASHYWEEEKLEAELAKVHDLIGAEMAAGWSVCPVGDARRHIGAEVAAAVLEALMEEAAAELAALMLTWNGRPRCDDDDAIDDEARCVVGAGHNC